MEKKSKISTYEQKRRDAKERRAARERRAAKKIEKNKLNEPQKIKSKFKPLPFYEGLR